MTVRPPTHRALTDSQVKALILAASAATTASDAPSLAPGTMLGPYEIAGSLGRGGMGEVYRARDRRLNREVAVKIVRGGYSADRREQFNREARAVARLEHSHICRLYDVGQDGELDYLVMEHLQGETLADRLARGSTTPEEAVEIATQIADALAHTHRHGLVHRDLKPANVMLTSADPDRPDVIHVRLLDFGLAKWLAAAGDPATPLTLVGTGVVAGTLQYMAPEQVDGQTVDGRADLFALGAILYEMLGGRPAFAGETPSETVSAILGGHPTPISTLRPDVPPALVGVIDRSLAKRPAERWASAGELADALRSLAGEQRSLARGAPRLSGARMRLGVGALARLAAAAVRGIRSRTSSIGRPGRPGGLDVPAMRRSIAVVGFRNLTGRPDAAWLSTAVAEMLTTELIASEQVRAIPGENVARMKIELNLLDAGAYASDTLLRVRANLGADLIVSGSYVALDRPQDRRIRLDLRVQDTRGGETIASVTDSGTEEDLFDLVSRAGTRLRTDLGLDALSAAASAGVRASMPSGTEAIRLYSRGLEKRRLFDEVGARGLLTQAVAADPSNAVVRDALAAALSALGYDSQARDEAKRAADLSASLAREQRLAVRARYRALAGDAQHAIQAFEELWRAFPDNLDYGLDLADFQTSGGRASDALATVAALRRLPPPSADDPRIDIAEARAHSALGEYLQCHDAAIRAVAKGAARGAPLLVAEAYRWDCAVIWRMGRTDEARAACAEAQRIARDAGDRHLEAMAIVQAANMHYMRREYASARAEYGRALTIFRDIGRSAAIAGMLSNIGNIDANQLRLDDAARGYEECLAIARELGRQREISTALNNLGEVTVRRGDLRRAIELHEQALAGFRETGDKGAMTSALTSLGTARRNHGEIEKARPLLQEAVRIAREFDQKYLIVDALASLAMVTAADDRLPEAATLCEEALSSARTLGVDISAASALVACAWIAAEQGRLAEAETSARQAVALVATAERPEDVAGAYAALAHAHLAEGKRADARDAVERAAAYGAPVAETRLACAVMAARVREEDSRPGAMASLQSVVDEATSRGFWWLTAEAQLRLGEMELRAGHVAAGRERLAGVERDAAAKGFHLFARKARAARTSSTSG